MSCWSFCSQWFVVKTKHVFVKIPLYVRAVITIQNQIETNQDMISQDESIHHWIGCGTSFCQQCYLQLSFISIMLMETIMLRLDRCWVVLYHDQLRRQMIVVGMCLLLFPWNYMLVCYHCNGMWFLSCYNHWNNASKQRWCFFFLCIGYSDWKQACSCLLSQLRILMLTIKHIDETHLQPTPKILFLFRWAKAISCDR